MKQANSKLEIKIMLCTPRSPIKLVAVSSGTLIGDLLSLYQPQDLRVFLYQGTILNPLHTFGSCGISDGDVLISLSNPTEVDLRKWSLITKDGETFAQSVGSMLNQNTAREMAKLRDLRFSKICQHPKFFNKFLSTFQEMNMDESSIKMNFNLTSHQTAPSTDALPVFW